MIEFRLLGPFEGPVPLPGGKPKALLARLLLDAGRVVPVATLVDSLWERPPPSAPKVLQAHVVALRKALGRDAIETRAGGYLLRRAGSDLARFEELAERSLAAKPDARARLLREALSLWRGEPLAEFRREPFAVAAAMRLGELRLATLERRLEAELELGGHERLVPELTGLVELEPLREPFRRLLMLALYRSGRQVDALAVYRDGRARMVDALGIEPGPELQALERAILRHDASLAEPARVERHGGVVCVGCAPVALLGALERELLVVELGADLAAAAARLRELGPSVRTAAFTSDDPVADVVRLARDQDADLLVVADAPPELLAAAPCDVALLGGGDFVLSPHKPVVVPFGGAKEEWAALELGAWLARAHGLPLRLVGAEATAERRDASRTLAAASLALQRFAGVVAEPAVVAPGAAGLLAQDAAVFLASLPASGPDATRRTLLERATVPVLLVHGGLRPSGLAPDRTLTRFSWSAAPDV